MRCNRENRYRVGLSLGLILLSGMLGGCAARQVLPPGSIGFVRHVGPFVFDEDIIPGEYNILAKRGRSFGVAEFNTAFAMVALARLRELDLDTIDDEAFVRAVNNPGRRLISHYPPDSFHRVALAGANALAVRYPTSPAVTPVVADFHAALQDRPVFRARVEAVVPARYVYISADVDDNAYIPADVDDNAWFDTSGAHKVWDDGEREVPLGVEAIYAHVATPTGAGVKVGIIDTGIYLHSDFVQSSGVSNIKQVIDCVGVFPSGVCQNVTTSVGRGNDDNGHGTHLTGIIAAANDNAGVRGVAPKADIYAIKAFDKSGVASTTDLLAALAWVPANGINLCNLSWGSGVVGLAPLVALKPVIEDGKNKGVIWVTSAGNSKQHARRNFPGAWKDLVITVAGTSWYRRHGRPAFGDWYPDTNFSLPWDGKPSPIAAIPVVTVAAPANDIRSTWPDRTPKRRPYEGVYMRMGGTSVAAAHVTGVIALMLEEHGQLPLADVREHLYDEASGLARIRDPGRANRGVGHVRIGRVANGADSATWRLVYDSNNSTPQVAAFEVYRTFVGGTTQKPSVFLSQDVSQWFGADYRMGCYTDAEITFCIYGKDFAATSRPDDFEFTVKDFEHPYMGNMHEVSAWAYGPGQ